MPVLSDNVMNRRGTVTFNEILKDKKCYLMMYPLLSTVVA
jgi:hypothetical protein